jgi:membrane-bound lytic murein transglycosylase A
MRLSVLASLLCACFLTACATVDKGPPYFPTEDVENPGVIVVAEPLETPPPAPEIPAPREPEPALPEEPLILEPIIVAPDIEPNLWYDTLEGWQEADHRPAMIAFRRSCESFLKADSEKPLNPNLPEYGHYRDWIPSCERLQFLGNSEREARAFFESEFAPLTLEAEGKKEGLLTGYYEPEIDVRLAPDRTFYEPILAEPKKKSVLKLPRAKLNATSSRVIAYGRPIDVFFMQIQGSGRIKYKEGRSLRAAYANNNGRPYKSIGKVLVDRGEMTLEQASKQSIEKWMKDNGYVKMRELMNQNPRYIFFKEQAIGDGEGPRGAMQVPLTDMGSIAIDPRYHPYGTLAWLETTLPQKGGDYRGKPARILVTAQDTGSAIRGPLRGDLFFGSGDEAGAKAGVMKHPVRWTIFVPKHIAPQTSPIS